MKELSSTSPTLGSSLGITHEQKFTRCVVVEEANSGDDRVDYSQWTIIHNTIAGYEQTFNPILKGENLRSFLHRKAKQNAKATILDIMASETFIADAILEGFAHGVAVSLGFPRLAVWDEMLGEDRVSTINGDVTRLQTWHDISRTMRRVAPQGFDVIISRPEGGLRSPYLSDNLLLHYLMLQRMWLLGARQSTLLFQAPIGDAGAVDAYVAQLRADGFDIHTLSESERQNGAYRMSRKCAGTMYGFPIRLEKKADAPRLLPRPN